MTVFVCVGPVTICPGAVVVFVCVTVCVGVVTPPLPAGVAGAGVLEELAPPAAATPAPHPTASAKRLATTHRVPRPLRV